MTLVGSLLSAMSGLRTTQAALQINANNIANVNTEGYTRKTASQETPIVGGAAHGVELGDVHRTVDQNLLRQIRTHIARLSGQQVQNDFLTRTQSLFGTPGSNTSLSHNLASLGSAFEAFALAPSSAVSRNSAVDTARRLADQLNSMSSQIQGLRTEADRAIAQSVDTVNRLLGEVQDLNGRIVHGQITGQNIEDLRDQRDLAIRELAGEIDIQVFERTSGESVIATGAGRILLDGQAIAVSHTAASQIAPQSAHPNTIGPIGYGPTGIDITDEITGGRLSGLIAQRDASLVDLQAEIDRLAEVLRDEINALHNDGTAYPPPVSLTGTRSLAATDAPAMTGSFRVSVLSADGIVVETLDIDLTALAPPNVGQLVTQINGMTNATAAFNADGQVVVAATGGNRIAVNELDSQVTSGNRSHGLAHFLGLNDLYDSGTDYDVAVSGRVASDTAALGQAGTLTFAIGGATTAVAYGAGDSLTDIATAITGALGGVNITATVVGEAGGYRLEIADTDGDNFFLSDSGGLTAQIDLRAGQAGTADRIAVRDTLLADPGLLAAGELSDAAGLAVGDLALSAGDAGIARGLADAFTSDHAFGAAGALPGAVTTLSRYAANIIALNAADANAMADDVAFGESFQIALDSQFASVSGVNLDEELSQLIILQNAYAASARVTTTVAELLDELLAIAR